MANMSDEEHPNVKFGNPLELYDDTNLPSKQSTVPIHEQTVTDEEGRRRFHGAFTGGFSAGYYNTVGSKDGWTPSTFKSSRKDKEKAKRATFRPQDFMDEEDMGDYGIAPKTVMAKQDFSSTRKRNYEEERLIRDHKQSATMFLGAELLQSLVVPARKNIGVRLLKKLGWKEGQGVGVRVQGKKPISSIDAIKKIYGCHMPPSEQENKNNFALTNDDDDDRCYEDITFAPKDTMSISITAKDDVHGIGYSGLNPSQALRGNIEHSTAVQIHTKSGAKMSFKGQAFGVGAFEDDDDDIYAMDSMENYDISMSGEKNPDSTYGWTKPAAITGAETREAIAERASNEVKGFVVAKSNKLLSRLNYPPPRIPADFDPNRRWKLHDEAQRIASMKLQASIQSAVVMEAESQFKQLNADDRHAILDGDEKKSVPAEGKTIKSIFDLVSVEDRERLKRATAKPDELGFKGKVQEASVINTKKQEEEEQDRSKPLCDVRKLKPFSGNLSKQRRYEEFERAVRQRKKDPYRDIVSNLTEWERNQERQEFSKAAQVYLHLANSINTKFEKAKTDEDQKMDPLNNEVGKKKIFGVLTHDNVEWHPDPLLCRRFNVPDPYPDSDLVGLESNSIFSSLRAIEMGSATMEKREPKEDENETPVNPAMRAVGVVSDTRRPPTFSHAKRTTKGRWDEEPQELGPKLRPDAAESSQPDASKEDDTTQSEEEEEDEKPSMDLFKSIFAASDDEDDTSSEEEEEEIQQPIVKPETEKVERVSHVFTKPIPKTPKPSETEQVERISHIFTKPSSSEAKNPSKPDQRQITRADFSTPSTEDTTVVCADPIEITDDEDDVPYGPPLPPPVKSLLPARPSILRSFSSSSSDDEYYEKKSKKHKKKKSKKDKKKKSKKKSKR